MQNPRKKTAPLSAKRSNSPLVCVSWPLVIAACLVTVRSGDAQEAVNLKTLRTTRLAGTDRLNVESEIERQVGKLLAADQSENDAIQFNRNMVSNHNHPEATPEFQQGLSQILAEKFRTQYKALVGNLDQRKPLGATMILITLKQFGQLSALPCYQAALADPAPSISLAAVSGLITIKEQLDDQQWTALLPLIDRAGAETTSSAVIARIYRLLETDDLNRLNQVLPTFLEILDRRFQQFEQDLMFPTFAEAQATQWLGKIFPQLDGAEAQQNEIVSRFARLLADAVYAHVHLKPTDQQAEELENVIGDAEKQLKDIVKKKKPDSEMPDVLKALTEGGEGDEERPKHMTEATLQWVGSGQARGLLNDAPFNLEPGLGIQRATPATAPAEE